MEKLIKQLQENPESLSFAELESLIAHHGYKKETRKGSSHIKYSKAHHSKITLSPHNNQVKNYQKKQVKTHLYPKQSD